MTGTWMPTLPLSATPMVMSIRRIVSAPLWPITTAVTRWALAVRPFPIFPTLPSAIMAQPPVSRAALPPLAPLAMPTHRLTVTPMNAVLLTKQRRILPPFVRACSLGQGQSTQTGTMPPTGRSMKAHPMPPLLSTVPRAPLTIS